MASGATVARWQSMKSALVTISSCLLFVLLVAPETHPHYATYLPIAASPQPSKCFAWAGGMQVPEQATVAEAGCFHNWTIERPSLPLLEMQVLWDRQRFGTDLMARLAELQTADLRGIMTFRRRPLVWFLTEPDAASNVVMPPTEAAALYIEALTACPRCIFFGPGVSAWDMHCDWPSNEAADFQEALRQKWGRWCYWQEFWQQVAMLDATAAENGRQFATFHHYDSVRWHEPRRGVAPLQPAEELAAMGARYFIVTEYGSCDPQMMRQMVEDYEADSRIVAHFVWAPQLEPVNGWPTCEALFEYGTTTLTAVGRAWRGK